MSKIREIISEIMARVRGEYTLKRLIKLGLQVGEGCCMERGCIIDNSHCWLIHMGNYVHMAPRVHILAHDGTTKASLGYTKIGRVEIGNYVDIGVGAIILPNVKIGDHVLIGAGCVVSKDIPSNSVVVGNPCRVIGSMEELVAKNKERMKHTVVYDETWTLRKNISKERKLEMYKALEGKWGYVD